MQINLKKLLFSITAYIPSYFTFFCILDYINEDTFWVNLLSKILFILIFSLIQMKILLKGKRKFLEIIYDIIFIVSLITNYKNYSQDGVGWLFNNFLFSSNLNFWTTLGVFIIWCDNKKILEFKEYIISNKKNITNQNIIICLIVIFSIITRTGFNVRNNTTTLQAYYGLEHILAYVMMIVLITTIFFIRNDENGIGWNHKNIFLSIISIVFIILTGVRSAFLAMCFYLFYEYFFMKLNKLKLAIYFFSILVFTLIFTTPQVRTIVLENNTIIKKTIEAGQTKAGFTNGRDNLRNVALNYYNNNTNGYDKLFGISIWKVNNEVYKNIYGYSLHAHNDLVNSLLGNGLIGVLFYILCFCNFCKGKNFILIFVGLFILIWFNGLYTYYCFAVSLPFIKLYAMQGKAIK